ncbi:anhydro-N-acetylmuramic acid kinase [Riemerella columbina]|uniref:anhydro-N-acetylmuramic acid kinase n=1 Tax=Riemerella columbina TaxID=103810 RepID=UPI00266F1714|nr:anhydro-N-acetylmuramic acid kinase [Riemerella columbina]WKS94684.1 anhydro-N-acetylmuramic acid kinase [Riemerella columbina]
MKIIGIMSGTSLDGIDFCYVDLDTEIYQFDILKAQTLPYPQEWVSILASASEQSPEEVARLNLTYTAYLNEMIHRFMATHQIKDLDLIASHGHTIWHNPNAGYTLQIGNLDALNQGIKVPIVCDFRVQDVALGGQGAPLVPIGDRLLFSAYDYCLNLGGFSNISFEVQQQRIAFDISPVNTLLNYFSEQGFHLPYDKNGDLARQGAPHPALIAQLNTVDYYQEQPPKSLGIESVKSIFIPMIEAFIDENKIAAKDVLASLVEHIAIQISNVLPKNESPKRILVTGGGAYHQYLIEQLQHYATPHQIHLPSAEIIEYKEALIFALLGVLRFQNKVNVLASVTGAKTDHSSGKILRPSV